MHEGRKIYHKGTGKNKPKRNLGFRLVHINNIFWRYTTMTENLNDIFTNADNGTPINAATDSGDGGLTVEIVNSGNGAKNSYTLYPENTLREVLDACKNDLSLASSGNQINFEFNGNTYSDPNLTVEKIGLVNGAKLLVNPNGQVAAEVIN